MLQSNSNEIKEIWKRLEKVETRLDELTKVVQNHSLVLGELTKRVEEMNKVLEEHTKQLVEVNKTLQEHEKRLEEISKILQEHSKILEEHSKQIAEITKILEEHTRILQEHDKKFEMIFNELKEHRDLLDSIDKRVRRMELTYTSFYSRAGHYIEKTMMELYKEALKTHGVDPDKVKYGKIVDELGVAGRKGKEYEVDFYEVNDNEIYLFEVKNYGDEGAIYQLQKRKAVFESLGKKVTKMYLVCNMTSDKEKEEMESEGIVVIAGVVTPTSKKRSRRGKK